MRNLWMQKTYSLQTKTVWTFEVYDMKNNIIVPETAVDIDERPACKVMERVLENGGWVPVSIIWEKFSATYTDKDFLASHYHLRLLEANGDAIGILRLYEGEHLETWTLYELKVQNVAFVEQKSSVKPIKVTFTFDRASYINNRYLVAQDIVEVV